MRTTRLPLVCCLAASPAVTQQPPCGFEITYQKNSLHFHNSQVAGWVEPPNFRAPGGNQAGDGYFRIFPKEIHSRPENRGYVTGFTWGFKLLNFTRGGFLVPGMEVRAAVRDTVTGYLIPDLASPPLLSLPPATAPGDFVPYDGYWSIRLAGTGIGWIIPRNMDLALMIRVHPGLTSQTADAYMPTYSARERYGMAPQPCFSGRYDARTNRFEFLGPPLTPAAGEIQTTLEMGTPVLQIAATSSGGNPADPLEEFLGVGAYYNDLASRGGALRLYAEDTIYYLPIQLGFPVLAVSRSQSLHRLPFLSCPIDLDPVDPFFWLLVFTWGPLAYQQVGGGHSSRADFLTRSPWVPIPADQSLVGATVVFQMLNNPNPLLYVSTQVTNSVALTLR